MIYYHNPRCSKSREGLKILEHSGKKFTVKEYLTEPMSDRELLDLFSKLGMSGADVVRSKEDEYKPYKGKALSDVEWAKIIVKTPKLLERPILVSKNKAVIGRPPENLKKLL